MYEFFIDTRVIPKSVMKDQHIINTKQQSNKQY